MSNDVSTEVKTISDKVRERIRENFSDLIPEDVWQSMVDQEVKYFIDDNIKKIVREEMEKVLRVTIKQVLSDAGMWSMDAGDDVVTDGVRELVKRIGPEIIMEGLAERVVQAVANDFRNNGMRYQ